MVVTAVWGTEYVQLKMNKLCPPNSWDDLCHLFCINPSSMELDKVILKILKYEIFTIL